MLLSVEAHAELSRQIESLEPSAAVLESFGFDWETAATLARFIRIGEPDIAALKDHGLPLETAINICTAISARHARLKPLAPLPYPAEPDPLPPLPDPLPPVEPDPLPPEPAAAPGEDDVDAALWQLAALTDQIGRGDACVTLLGRAGFSESTAREIANLIRVSTRSSRRR